VRVRVEGGVCDTVRITLSGDCVCVCRFAMT
jgi:hypothetical protein